MKQLHVTATALVAMLVIALSFDASGAPIDDQAQGILGKAAVKGGLIVVLGCEYPGLLANLRKSDAFVIHGLDHDPAKVKAARRAIQEKGLYGPVSVEVLQRDRLPYIDNLVNLCVRCASCTVSEDEIRRILAPGGVCIELDAADREASPEHYVKPVPEGLDEWTHYLYGPGNENTSRDVMVGPPRGFQWLAEPRWTRNHDVSSSFQSLVSGGGRNYAIIDKATRKTLYAPAEWTLEARDAFNGILLWERPLPEWLNYLFSLKSGPVVIMRRLVAKDDRLYVTLGGTAAVSELDGPTGGILRTFEGTGNTQEILVEGETLFAVTGADIEARSRGRVISAGQLGERVLKAVDLESGDILWELATPMTPVTLAADGKKVCFHNGAGVVALDRRNGRKMWQSTDIPIANDGRLSFFAPNLVLYKDVVLFSGGPEKRRAPDQRGRGRNDMFGLDGKTGEILWKAQHLDSAYASMKDLHVHNGLVWQVENNAPRNPMTATGRVVGLDYRTGEVVRDSGPNTDPHNTMHHRCYVGRATGRYLITSWMGAEFIDWQTLTYDWNQWARGTCSYGLMPANGLLYLPPNPCQCYLGAMLHGYNAMRPVSALQEGTDPAPRLQKGPAYTTKAPARGQDASSWNTYRADFARSGAVEGTLNLPLEKQWTVDLGGRATQPVCTDGKIYVAIRDRHEIVCLDHGDGQKLWSFTAGGRIDSSPTLWRGRLFFGCRDGRLYCLERNTGALVWTFRAAPREARLMAFGQLESVWPLHGSVLIQGGNVHVVAGRHRYADGGLRYIIVNATSGELASEQGLSTRDPQSGEDFQALAVSKVLPFSVSDILSTDGEYIYMGTEVFDRTGKLAADSFRLHLPGQERYAHLIAQNGFLDDSWFFRSYWTFATAANSHPNRSAAAARDNRITRANMAGEIAPSGRILCFTDGKVYGYGRRPGFFTYGIGNMLAVDYRLFCSGAFPESHVLPKSNKYTTFRGHETEWEIKHSVLAYGMALVGDKLLTAGPPDMWDENGEPKTRIDPSSEKQKLVQDALNGEPGARLVVNSADDGKQLQELELEGIPVFDGLSAADGRVYVSLDNGSVVCYGQ